MRQIIYIFLALLLFNCSSEDKNNNEENQLIGKWQAEAHLLDPGDGSGEFKPVETQRIIEFFSDGTVKVNGDLCFLTIDIGSQESGTYQIISDDRADTTHDGEIIPDVNCNSGFNTIYFDLTANGKLIVWYSCIEPCGERFEKID